MTTAPHNPDLARSAELESRVAARALDDWFRDHPGMDEPPPPLPTEIPEGFTDLGPVGYMSRLIERDGKVWVWPHQDGTAGGADKAEFLAAAPFLHIDS